MEANSFILKGDGAQGMELTFASLMARASDELDALYGLAARAARVSTTGNWGHMLPRSANLVVDGT